VFILDASLQTPLANLILDSTNLKYQSKDGSKIGLKVVGINPRNSTKREVEIGDKDGDIKTYVIYGTHSERELKRLGSQYLAQFKYSGFEDGSYFTTFGEPFIKLLQPIGFEQLIYTNNYEIIEVSLLALDVYQCTGINHIYSESGFRQQIYLGIKLSNDLTARELNEIQLSKIYPMMAFSAPPLSVPPKNILGTDIPKDEGAIDIGASKVDDYSPLDDLDIDFDRDFL
jgi:hypothetical protein